MLGFIGEVEAARRSVKRYAEDFSSAFRSKGANINQQTGNIASNFDGKFDLGVGASPRPFEVGWQQNGANPYGPALQESDGLNPVVTLFARRYKPFGSEALGDADLGPPSERNLAFVWRSRPAISNPRIPLGDNGTIGGDSSMLAMMNSGSTASTKSPFDNTLSIQGEPALAGMPHQMNFLLTDTYRVWSTHPGGRHVTPMMLAYGASGLVSKIFKPHYESTKDLLALPGFVDYEGFAIDGIVRNIVDEKGMAPQYNDGLWVRGGGLSGRAEREYVATVINKGQEEMLDLTNGAGMHPGASYYAVLKKWPIDAYTHVNNDKKTFHFDLTTKAHDQFRDGARMQRTITIEPVKDYNGNPVPAQPPMWGFITSAGALDREYAKQIDECGEVSYGVIVYLGKVGSVPFTGSSKPRPTPAEFRPYMSNLVTSRSAPFEMLLNVDDGFKCMG